MIFIATSECYMALSYVVNKAGRKLADPIAQRSLRYKRNLCLLNIASFALAGYFFVRHNDRCEPLSKFAECPPLRTSSAPRHHIFPICSVHLVRLRRVRGRPDQHGLSHDRRV